MHHDQPAATVRLPLSPPVIGLIAFFTLVDLFATQAILPLLVHRYGVSPAAMGVAVNASTLGMAIGAAAAALFGDLIERRAGIVASLLVLAVPTALLAGAPGLGTFAALPSFRACAWRPRSR
jgi:MFS transporter, YNFM family, putative membrane transport protein